VKRRLELDDASLNLTPAGPHRSLMLFHNVYTLNDHTLFIREHALDNAPPAPLIACDHFNGVTFFNPKHVPYSYA
jgi:hypothetical protein